MIRNEADFAMVKFALAYAAARAPIEAVAQILRAGQTAVGGDVE